MGKYFKLWNHQSMSVTSLVLLSFNQGYLTECPQPSFTASKISTAQHDTAFRNADSSPQRSVMSKPNIIVVEVQTPSSYTNGNMQMEVDIGKMRLINTYILYNYKCIHSNILQIIIV